RRRVVPSSSCRKRRIESLGRRISEASRGVSCVAPPGCPSPVRSSVSPAKRPWMLLGCADANDGDQLVAEIQGTRPGWYVGHLGGVAPHQRTGAQAREGNHTQGWRRRNAIKQVHRVVS